MKYWIVGAAAACAISAGAGSLLHAQQRDVVSTQADRDDERLSEKAKHLLALPVTIQLSDVSQRRAIDLVAGKAGVRVSYRLDVVSALRKTVTLNVANAPLAAVFERVLAGTTLKLAVLAGDQLAVIPAPGSEAQAAGTIAGQLRDETGRAISGARVAVRGTTLVAESKSNGTFRFGSVPTGTYVVSASRLGFAPAETTVKLAANDSVSVTLVMRTVSTRLTEVVTTATGQEARLKVGNDVGTINADSLVQNGLMRNVTDLLTAHTPGVQVTAQSGAVGAPSRIRIRGIASAQLNNDPIVVVDGVRINAQTTLNTVNFFGSALPASQVNTGKTTMTSGALAPSPLDQIDPNSIESIDVLKGPTATALYGPDASTGVIVIKTKMGKPGPWRYHASGDYGWIVPPREYPLQWTAWGHTLGNAASQPGCNLASTSPSTNTQSNNGCLLDSITAFNPQNDPQLTTLGTGYTRSVTMDASGGGQTVQGFLQGDYSDALGQQVMSAADQRRIARLWTTSVPSWMKRPNAQKNIHVTSKVQAQFTPDFDVSVTGQGTYQDTRNDGTGLNSTFGALGPGDTLTYLPADNIRARSTTTAKRALGASNLRYQAFSWLVLTGTGGLDYSIRDDQGLQRAQDCTVEINPSGCSSSHQATRTEVLVPSFTTGATFTYNLTSWLSAHTAFGEQFSKTQTYVMGVSATSLAFGQNLITGGTIGTPIEQSDESASAGWYAEQQFGINDRLFLTAALRRDASSAFGNSIQTPTFPKYGASWVLSNEPFFPRQNVLTQVRLRAAYGESGKQGSQSDVLRNFLFTTGLNDGVSTPVLVFSGIGNPLLEPQRDKEWEGGFDLSFYNDRATMTATWYRKQSDNAIMSVNVPPSPGVTVPIQAQNIGSIRNTGYELQLSVRPVDHKNIAWDFNLQASHNDNILLDKGNLVNIPTGSGGTIKAGFPLYGFWQRPVLSYDDTDGDGVLEANEIVFGDSAVFVGSSDPKGTLAYSNTLTLLGGWLRVSSLFNQVIGMTARLNTTVNNSASSLFRARVDKNTSLAEQAAAMQASLFSTGAIAHVSYLSFAELSASITLPTSLAHRFRSQSATVTLAGRNLGLWTNYRGSDPMTGSTAYSNGGELVVDDGTGLSQPRNWVVRFNFQF